MRNRNGEPRGGSVIWLLAVLVIALAAKVDTATADIVVLGIALYAVNAGPASRG